MSSKIQVPNTQTLMPGASAAGTHRRAVLKAAAAAAMLSAGAPLAFAQSAPNALRIGWAISKTGPNAGGVSASISGNYRLWAWSRPAVWSAKEVPRRSCTTPPSARPTWGLPPTDRINPSTNKRRQT